MDETRLKFLDMSILRRIYDPSIDNYTGEWCKRHNCEIEELFKRPDIAKEIKKRRVTWADHAW